MLAHTSTLLLVGALAIASWLAVKSLRAARRLRQSEPDQRDLKEGPATISGVVEYAARATGAVKLEVLQHASEKNDSEDGLVHTWAEVERELHVEPFYLRTDDGERVRIEPDREASVIDAFDRVVHHAPTERTRIAELTLGERVIAVGVLASDLDPEGRGADYRTMSSGWVLRPPHGGGMVLSSQPLARPMRRVSHFHLAWLGTFAVAFVVAQVLLWSYYQRLWWGTTGEAVVVGGKQYTTTDDDGYDHTHYRLDSKTSSGYTHAQNIDVETWALELKPGSTVVIRHAGNTNVQYGSAASSSMTRLIIVMWLALATIISYPFSWWWLSRRWSRDNVTDRAKGPIDATTGLANTRV